MIHKNIEKSSKSLKVLIALESLLKSLKFFEIFEMNEDISPPIDIKMNSIEIALNYYIIQAIHRISYSRKMMN
jgi:hypothetical protein